MQSINKMQNVSCVSQGFFRYVFVIFISILQLYAYDIKVVPTLSSNPTSGTGLGAMASLVYEVDEASSPSQALALVSYTNTDSYNAFFINNMFFNDDKYIANTILGYVYNNSEFYLAPDIPNVTLPETDANFQAKALIINQQLLYRIAQDFYLGGQFFYTYQSFDSKNALGSAFLIAKGIDDSSSSAIGIVANYDTRTQKEKLYPRDATYTTITFNYSPKKLGNSEDFTDFELDMRKYIHGFKPEDVFAIQGYLKTSSKNTPDGSLAALGIKNVLRGFSIGQYKARNLAALQGEYRYELKKTNFKFSAFAGIANLSGGSKGTSTGNRDADNGNYLSGGLGVQYVIQKEAGVVYRVDVVTTSKHEQSIYATVNQAF